MKTVVAGVVIAAAAFASGICPPATPDRPAAAAVVGGQKDIIDTAIDAGKFSTLAKALAAADLVDALRGDGPFTVLAPTDEAFAALGDRGAALFKPENKARLTEILKYHVVPGNTSAASLISKGAIETLDGQRVLFTLNDGRVNANDSKLVVTDIACSNDVIHVIDKVLVPAKSDIVQTADKAGKFKTLLAAAKAAGLAETLSGPGPFTVLAPSDDAFAKLPEGAVATLLKPENRDQLRSILTYHVIPTRAYSKDAAGAGSVATVQGDPVRFSIRDGQLCVNNASIVKTDIDVANGVIHVIDSVLMPASAPAMPAQGSSPERIISLAISRGVPLFNEGKPDACEAVYEVAISGLLALPKDQLGDEARAVLAAAIKERDASHDPRERAWVLRRGLDAVQSMTPSSR